jgi:hypothetical protein
VNASLDRQAKILQGNASLTNAINNLSQVRASGNAGIFDKAQSIRAQADSEEDPEKKAKLEEILSSIGINAATTELELIKQKQAEENKAAQLKMEALRAEQEQAKAQLEIQLRQQELAIKLEQISARRALIEAQISSAKAQQALLDAQAAKGKADQIKDPAERAQAQAEAQNAIATAQLGVEAAGQQTELAKEQSAIANQAAEDQKASAIEQRKLLAVQQDTQTNQLGLDERQRKIDQSVELVNAGGNPLSRAEINSANDLITRQSDLTAQAIKEKLEKDKADRGIIDRLPSGQNPGDVVDFGVALTEATNAIVSFTNAALTASGTSSGKGLPVVKLAGARLLGGGVDRGSSYLGGEGGPELVGFEDGSAQMIGLSGPEIFKPKKGGHVYTARETVNLLRQARSISAPNMPTLTAIPNLTVHADNTAVVRELQKLQKIAAKTHSSGDTNHITLGHNGENTFEMIANAMSALNQFKRR